MATIIGGVGTSHIPAIANAMGSELYQDPYWAPFFDDYGPVREWLNDARTDVAIMFYNDHGLNFFLNAMPTFAIGVADRTRAQTRGGASAVSSLSPATAPFPGTSPNTSWRTSST